MSAVSRPFERGASLLTALFFVVVVTMLAAFAVQIGTTQRQAGNFGALVDRANAAAQSGIEWGAYQALTANACNAPLNGNLALNQGALNGFTVRVTCTPALQNDCPGPQYRVFDVTAFAQWRTFGTPEYVSRQIAKRFTNATC